MSEAEWFAPGEDAAAILRSRLSSWQPGGMNRDDRTPIEWIERAWYALDAAGRARLERGMVQVLDDPDVRLQAGAIHFFHRISAASDHGALAATWRARRSALDGVPDPFSDDGWDLRAVLARTIGGRMGRGDPNVDILHEEILRAGQGDAVIAALADVDMDFIEDNAGEIAARMPSLARNMLRMAVRHDRPLAPLVTALADRLPRGAVEDAIRASVPADRADEALAGLP